MSDEGIKPLQVRAYFNPPSDKVEFYVRDGVGMVAPVETKPVPRGTHQSPTFRLENGECQTLMDDLWACGIRPTEGKGSAGAMAATQKHLEDMRTIAFAQLEIEKA